MKTDAQTVAPDSGECIPIKLRHQWNGVKVSRSVWTCQCALLRGKPREVEEPLFFEPPSRGLPGIGERCLDRDCKKVFFGLPDSPSARWKELRDTLQGGLVEISRTGPSPSFCLRDFSGDTLIGVIIVHVDDMLLATNSGHQAESHFSRLLSKNDTKDVKRAGDDGGVLYCGKRVRTVLGRYETWGVWLCNKTKTEFCESSLRTCKYVSSPRPDKREASVRQAKFERCEV